MATEWNGDDFLNSVKENAAKGLLTAAVFFENTMRQRVSMPSPFFTEKKAKQLIRSKKGINKWGFLRNLRSDANGRIYYDPSAPGEYPKLRTGAGQKALTHQPETVQDVIEAGFVRVGYVEGNHHLLALEMAKDRLGLLQTLEDLRPQLAELATGAFKG